MNFTPIDGRVHFEPIKQDSVILNDATPFVEAGVVITFGTDGDSPHAPVKKGDIIYFLAYGAEEAKDKEGNSYWTVLWDKKFIMGTSHA